MSQCVMLEDQFKECELEDMGFQFLIEEIANCRECKCKSGMDAECVAKCSPRSLYERQLTKLVENGWTDRQTRAIFLDTAIYYQNFNLFQVSVRRQPTKHQRGQ
eukprot:1115277-Prorocentrum_minimum.AAC.1